MRTPWLGLALAATAGCLQPALEKSDAVVDAGGTGFDAGISSVDGGPRDAGCASASSCDDGPFSIDFAGACLADGCRCATSFELNPQTGRCRSTGAACTGDLTPYLPVTPAQAACIGIAAPVCATCHRLPCGYQVRPTAGPPPPVGIDTRFDAGCLL